MTTYGLQVWNSSGVLQLSTADSITRFIAAQALTGSNGSYSNADFASGREWAIFLPNMDTTPSNPLTTLYITPTISFSGTTYSWSYPTAPAWGSWDDVTLTSWPTSGYGSSSITVTNVTGTLYMGVY